MNRFEPTSKFRPLPPTIGLQLMPCPPTRTLESLLVAIFMCLPLGIAALYCSSKVESRYHTGRYDEAAAYSAKARTFITWGTCIGAVAWIVIAWLYLTGTLQSTLLTLTL